MAFLFLCVLSMPRGSRTIYDSRYQRGHARLFREKNEGKGQQRGSNLIIIMCVNYMFMTNISLGSHRLKASWSVVHFFFFQKNFEVFMCCFVVCLLKMKGL